jgi:uncharacterized protein YfaP (DUF2135 family)
MIGNALARRRKRTVATVDLRDRALAARRYIAAHPLARGGRRRYRHFIRQGLAIGILLVLGVLVADQSVAGVRGTLDAFGDAIAKALPVPIIDRGPQATAEPVAPNAAPILDSIDRVTKDARLTVSGRLPSFARGGSPSVEIALNGALAAAPGVDADGKFQATVVLANGSNTIVVTVVRGDERASALPRTIVLDTVAPTLTLTKPADNATVDGPNVAVEGKTEAGASLTVNGNGASVSADGTFATTVPATLGSFAIDLVARDQAGNETKKTVRVTVQQSAQNPSLFVTVTLDRTSAKPGANVTADVFVSDHGNPSMFASVTVTVGLNTVVRGNTDVSGHYKTTFTAPSTEGFIQVSAAVTGADNTTSGRGGATLEVTKS